MALGLVICLLTVAGGVLLYDTVPLLPDVVDFTFDAGPFSSLGLFYVVYLLELSLLGGVLLRLAYGLYRRRPVARLAAAVLGGALGVSYLLQAHRAETETSVMVMGFVVTGVLAVAPAASEAGAVRAAGWLGAALGVALGVLGLSALPGTSVAGVFGFIGVGLCIGTVLSLRSLGGLRAGDAGARTLLSGVMAGDVALLLLARSEAPAATALVVPMVVAGAVVALLWIPPSSQVHFAVALAEPAPAPAPVPAPPAPVPVHVAVGVVAGSKMAKSSVLGLVYDQESWFPEPAADERVIGAYLVLALLHGAAGPRDREFEGTSTLLITDRRLAGVCPKGAARQRPLDSVRGPVIPWAVPLADVTEATPATSSSGPYLSLRLTDRPECRLLLAKPRIVRADSFAPVDIAQLARDLKRAGGPTMSTSPYAMK